MESSKLPRKDRYEERRPGGMSHDEIRRRIEHLVAFIEAPSDPVDLKLLRLLDELMIAWHNAEFEFDQAYYPEPPDQNYTALYQRLGSGFPEYGYYNQVLSLHEDIWKVEVGLGDAMDDVVDIYQDMKNILWHWDHTSVEEALWNFKEGYKMHWGEHARWLQNYLHDKLCYPELEQMIDDIE